MNLPHFLESPRFLRTFHGIATLVWLALIVPSLTVWKDSLLWVIVMSAWANVAGHWSAWQAARAEEKGGQ